MKPYILHISILIFTLLPTRMMAQGKASVKGQASFWANYRHNQDYNFWTGARYLPALTYQIGKEDTSLFDLEVSANVFASAGSMIPFDTLLTDANISPYRAWARYSTQQLELRVGLQKINFGSATTLRPLMWFDQIDPRDPLQLTNGVWGALGRYYFLNNANIWLWALYGNERPKGFEQTNTFKQNPEFGGRFQFPVKQGELAFSYHHRTADSRNLDSLGLMKIPENRIGIDGKWDLRVGLWFEASYIQKQRNLGPLTNQLMLNVGTDYTFGVGNGLNVVVEQLFIGFDSKPFAFEQPTTFTAMTLSYPIGLFDNVSTVLYYDWGSNSLFSFLNWQMSLNNFTLFAMGYVNPRFAQLPQQNDLVNPFSGAGVQLMVVYNH